MLALRLKATVLGATSHYFNSEGSDLIQLAVFVFEAHMLLKRGCGLTRTGLCGRLLCSLLPYTSKI